jgi:hypothetical protein
MSESSDVRRYCTSEYFNANESGSCQDSSCGQNAEIQAVKELYKKLELQKNYYWIKKYKQDLQECLILAGLLANPSAVELSVVSLVGLGC